MFLKKKTPSTAGRMHASRSTPREPVFSYHASRSVRMGAISRNVEAPQQDALRRGPRFPWLKRLPRIAALLMLLLLLAFCLQVDGKAKVVAVGTDDSHIFLRDHTIYENAARASFQSLLNSNKLTINTSGISADLRRQFPELKVVSVSLPIIGNQPVVYIQPAAPKLILLGGGGMYVLDVDGRALLPANQVADLEALHIPVVTDQSNLAIETGKVVLPKSIVAFIGEIIGQHQAKGIKITSLTLPPDTNELYVRLDGAGYFVKYNLHGNAREEAGAFLAVKARLEAEQKTPKEYIDVRVENRAYYK